MARRGRRQVLQLDDVSTSHPSRHSGFGLRRSEDTKQEQLSSNPLLSLVGYSSDDASSDEGSDNAKTDEEIPTPSEPEEKVIELEGPENGDRGVSDLDIPLPVETEPVKDSEPGTPPELKEEETEQAPESKVGEAVQLLEIPLPESSCPPAQPLEQEAPGCRIDSEVANFLAEIESISAEPSQDNKTDADIPSAVDSSIPADADIGFIPRPDASVPLATEEKEDIKPPAPVEEKKEKKSKPSSTAGAYKSMFVKGASEFVKKEKEGDTKSNGAEVEEELPEEPKSPWQMVQDDSTQYYYYWNTITSEVTWEIPPGYTQFLLLYKEYEERIAAIPKDKLQRMKERKEKKKEDETTKRDTAPAPSSSHGKKEKKHKRDKHRKEKAEPVSSQVEIGPQLPPVPSEASDTNVQPATGSAEGESSNDGKEKPASSSVISEERKEVKLTEDYDSAVDSTSMSVPEDVEAIFDDALNSVAESSSADGGKPAAQPVSSTSTSDTTSSVPSASVTSSASLTDSASCRPTSSVESSKIESSLLPETDSTAVVVSGSTAMVSSSSVVSTVSLPEGEEGGENGEGVVTNSGVKDDGAAEGEEEDDFDMDFDDIDDLDRALEKALEKKKAELEKLEKKSPEDMAVPDTLPPMSTSSTADPSQSEASSEITPSSASAPEPESVVSSSVKMAADVASAAVAGSSKSTSGSSTHSGEKDVAETSGHRPRKSKSKRSAVESSGDDDGTAKVAMTVKKARLVAYDAAETDEENVDVAEEVSTTPGQGPDLAAYLEMAAAVLPTPPPETVDSLTEIQEMADTVCAKLAFLEVTVEGLTPLQTSLIALQTRLSDWQAGGLNGEYFFQRLKEVNDLLKGYESGAVPDGWTCQWDSNFRRYFYTNMHTGEAQWDYPDGSAAEVPQGGDRKSRKGKGSKRKRTKLVGPEPMPAPNPSADGLAASSSSSSSAAEGNEATARSEAAVAGQEVMKAGQEVSMEVSGAGQEGLRSSQESRVEEDLDGVAMSEEDVGNGVQANREIGDKPTITSTGEPDRDGIQSALQALFPGEPLPPGTELMLGLPPPPPPPLPAEETPDMSGDAYVCADDSSSDGGGDSDKKEEEPGEERAEAANIDPDIDGEEMVEEEEEGEEKERKKQEEEEEESVVEDPAIISRPPQLRFPPAAAGLSSGQTGVESSSTVTAPHVLSAAPVLNAAAAQWLPDSVSAVASVGSPKTEDFQKPVGSPAPVQEASSGSTTDQHKPDKQEKPKKKKKEKLGSHTMSLKKKGVSSLVQKWQKVKKEVEKEERASEQRQQAIRQQLEEWKKENSNAMKVATFHLREGKVSER